MEKIKIERNLKTLLDGPTFQAGTDIEVEDRSIRGGSEIYRVIQVDREWYVVRQDDLDSAKTKL